MKNYKWYMISDEFNQARRLSNQIRLDLYGTYKTNFVMYIICMFLGNQEDIIIDFSGREEQDSSFGS